jgi:fumarate hydratase class II
MTSATRTERDAFGDIEVPAAAMCGAQAQRSFAHFRIATEGMRDVLLHAPARVKRCAALVNVCIARSVDRSRKTERRS